MLLDAAKKSQLRATEAKSPDAVEALVPEAGASRQFASSMLSAAAAAGNQNEKVEEAFVPKSKICLISYFAPGTAYETQLKPLVSPNKKQYAEARGYDYIDAFDLPEIVDLYSEHKKMHNSNASHYFKLRLIPYILDKYNYEWIMWCDGDAVFFNFKRGIEEYLDADYDIIYSSALPTKEKWIKVINTGHFIVKNSDWSKKFFYEAYALSFINCWEYLGGKPPINGWLNICHSRTRYLFADQRVLQYYVTYAPEELYGCHFKHYGFRDFNAEFPEYRDGDIVVHFPGRPMHQKKSLIKMFIENADFAGGGHIDQTKFPELKQYSTPFTLKMDIYDQLVNKKCKK